MRILYSHYLATDEHPAVRMVKAIAEQLRAMGHEVVVHRSFGPAVPSAEGKGNIECRMSNLECRIANVEGEDRDATHEHHFVIRDSLFVRSIFPWAKGKLWFAKAMARNLAMVKRDRRAVRRFQPEVVLARQDAYCWSMPLVCRRQGIPLVTYADAPVAYETRLFGEKGRWHPPWLVEAIERWGLKQSRAVITVSQPAASRLQRYALGVPVNVVPNGVHPARFPDLSSAKRANQRRALGLGAAKVVGFLGTFRPFHGVDRLRELMLGTSHRADVQWLLIGDGPQRKALQDAVVGRVGAVFLGMQPAERIGRLLSLVDVAVAPHAYTAGDFYFCPLKILEFAAAGSVVIASDQGDIPMLLDEGRAGVLVPQPDLAAWQAALDRVLNDDRYRRSLGQAARRFVLSNFTWHHTAGRVEHVLRRVLADGHPELFDAEDKACSREEHAVTST